MISSFCCSPTLKVPAAFSRGTFIPYWSIRARIFSLAAFLLITKYFAGSIPMIMFSRQDSSFTSIKC